MKNTLRQVFHSSKFLTGFLIFAAILLTMWIYPLFNPGNPLEMIGVGTFAQPGTYFSLYDAATTRTETLRLPDADEKRITNLVSDADRAAMIEWFGLMDIDVSEVDATDIDALLDLWLEHYDPSVKIKGMTQARRNFFKRLDKNLRQIRAADTLLVMHQEEEELVEKARITKTDYVNVSDVANVKRLPLGTDNFGRDVLKELVSATGTSIVIGLIAGTVATLIGLTLGLLAGYVGGLADDIIMFITNIFTVIRRHCHRPDKLDLDSPFGPLAGHQSAQPRPRQPLEAFRPQSLPHHSDRYSPLHRLLCGDGLYSAGLFRHSRRGAAVAAGTRPQDHRHTHAGSDDELGHALLGAHQRFLVGLLPRDPDHHAHLVLAEPDEHRPGSGVQPHPAGLRRPKWEK